MGVANVPRDAFEVRIALDKALEDFVLLLVAGLHRHAVLHVAPAVVVLVAPEVIRLDAQQDIDIGQALRAEIARLLPAPEHAAEIAVKADRQPLFLGDAQHIQHQLAAIRAERRGDAAQVQPVKALQQRAQIDVRKIVFGHGAVLAVVNDLAGADAVARLQVIRAQTVGRRFLRRGQDHRGAVHVVGAQPAHGALAEAVAWHDGEERAVHAEVGQREGDVGLAAAIAGLKPGGHADFFVVRRRQAKHDFAHRDEFPAVFHVLQKRIIVDHRLQPAFLLVLVSV